MDFLRDAQEALENEGGFEEVNSSTMAIPFLKLAQELSPQMKKSKAEYIEGLKLGDFFNSITGEIYGTNVELIFLKFTHMYIEWLPRRGGFAGYLTPDEAKKKADDLTFGAWKTKEGNDLTEYYTYHIILVGHEEEGPLALSLKSGSITTGKSINRQMTTHMMDMGEGEKKKRAKPFFLVYSLDSILIPKGAEEYFGYVFKFKTYIEEFQLAIIEKEKKALPDKHIDYTMIENKSHSGGNTEEYDDSDL